MRIAALLLTLSLLNGAAAQAEEAASGAVEAVATRGVSVPIFAQWNSQALATVVLYSGGAGGYGKLGQDGWPGSFNFLIRSAKQFAAHRVNVVLVGRASDVAELDGGTRIGAAHALDNQALFRAVKAHSDAPIWLVGTSMGTISATAAAIHDDGQQLAGIVLTSSITAYRVAGAVPSQDLEKIRLPVLVLHHERDACKSCTPWEAKTIADKLKNAPIKKTVLVNGGANPTGDPCGALHYHGYIGMEKEVVDLIVAWVLAPSS